MFGEIHAWLDRVAFGVLLRFTFGYLEKILDSFYRTIIALAKPCGIRIETFVSTVCRTNPDPRLLGIREHFKFGPRVEAVSNKP